MLTLGGVGWITEEFRLHAAYAVAASARRPLAPVEIAAGEDTLRVRVTVGFDVAR